MSRSWTDKIDPTDIFLVKRPRPRAPLVTLLAMPYVLLICTAAFFYAKLLFYQYSYVGFWLGLISHMIHRVL